MGRISAFLSWLGPSLRTLTSAADRQPLRTYGLAIAGLVGVAVIGWLLVSRWNTEDFTDSNRVDPAYAAYIESYTGGVISKETSLTLRFYQPVVDSAAVREPVSDRWFHFKPAVAGTTYWIDRQTITFIPKEPWQSGQRYQVKFALDHVLNVPEKYHSFEFSLLTMAQNYSLEVEGLEPVSSNDYTQQQLQGTLLTADVAEASAIETMLTVSESGSSPLDVTWDHAADQRTHRFTVSNIVRQDSTRTVQLSSRGGPISVDSDQQQTVRVPGRQEFVLLDHRIVTEPEQYVELRFSDPLLPDQSLEGLIQVSQEDAELRFVTDKNIIRVYPGERLLGTTTLALNEGIKNSREDRFGTTTELELDFEAMKPAIRLAGQGVILPSTDGMVLPFEAVNLRAVDVTVMKVYEDHLPQFFQVNQLDGDQELRRVGRPVTQRPVPLNGAGVTDLGQWNRFTLDLNDLMRVDPGALYRVIIGFRQSQVVLPCQTADSAGTEQSGSDEPWTENWDDPTRGSWEAYSDYYYAAEFNWEDRDDPCTPSYYGSRRSAQKNLIASNLGLIAQRGTTVVKEGAEEGSAEGEGNLLRVAVTDLKTTEPRAGVNVRLYDFQERALATQTTDDEGWAEFTTDRIPFLVVAEDDSQRGYLRVDDGTSLPLSNFDVSGQRVPDGLKGLLYGDRGVWRPGDSLHLNFIIEDVKHSLPDYYPVIFQLKDPRGNTVRRIVRNRSVGGIYTFSTDTPQDAPTGTWSGEVQVGGTTFTQPLRIETIKPNRLKIELDFDRDRFTARNRRPTGTLNVAWLSGATARNLRAQYDLVLAPTPTSFAQYPKYVFDDPSRSFGSERKEVFDERTDSEGNAEFNLDLSLDQKSPGVLNATLIGKVFEEGGNFSTDQQTLPYYPYRAFVGLQLPEGEGWNGALTTGKEHTIDLVTVDADGDLTERDELEITLHKLDWQWWWDQSSSNLANYVNNEYQRPVLTETVTADSGHATWNFRIANEDWGRYYVRACDPESEHCAGTVVYLDGPDYAGGDDGNNPQGATMLTFTADREQYTVGETATIHIPGTAGGRALVSLENGSQVLETHWVTMPEGQPEATFSFEITEAMAPNVYVHVSRLQPHAQTANDLPIRLYGLLNLTVENPATYLQPVISMPAKVAPESEVRIQVSEAQQRPMAYTVAVVDEGLLDITRFATPDPHAHFYAREALGVKTWDLYDYVIGAYGGQLERLLSVGGDGAAPLGPESRETNRFLPVVKFLGPFFLEEGKTNEHTVTLPNYVGSVRTMVVAAHEGAYGHADTTTQVSKPLMVLGTLPRALSPGETVSLPVDVFAMEHTVKNARVNVDTDERLSVTSEPSQEVYFGTIGDEVINYQLKVGERTGVGQVRVNAAAGPVRASYEVNVPIRNPNSPQVQMVSKLIGPGEQWETTVEPFGTPGTNAATLEVSSIPPLNLGRRLPYLINYPHGCVEQVTSAAFPQLFLSSVTELDEARQAQAEGYVKAAIDKLRSFRTNEGAFAYWEGHDDADEWCTNYVGHFLLESQQHGYAVPSGLLSGWTRYQQQRARQWGGSQQPRDDLTQAYRLYTLALAGQPASGAMNRMRERGRLSLAARWRLAAAYALVGQIETAEQLVDSQNDEVPAYQETGGTYGSAQRDEAMVLETLTLLDRREQGLSVFRRISSALSDESQWMSTQTTAFCLVAATEFAETLTLNDEINARYQAEGQAATELRSKLSVVERTLDPTDGAAVRVTNQGKGDLYAQVVLRGTPPLDTSSAQENGLRLQVNYKGTDGEPLDPTSLAQGTDFMAEMTVANPGLKGDYHQLALTQVLPSGWEIINTRLEGTDSLYTQGTYDYRDIRDDRVLTYFDLAAGERKTFTVLLNATYAGQFYHPAIYAEAMYDNTINGKSSSKYVEVVAF